eukprot:TRINITY_DN4954_c1_g1_i1.p1 TRINITY_DN4954_c1_g1~~TRINITY_DN4954_c1_g1_i1.p1  ORF type:complete len:363 (-),score=67.37 TRINITY_DN4954_c1_g1_i1:339-1427(-)
MGAACASCEQIGDVQLHFPPQLLAKRMPRRRVKYIIEDESSCDEAPFPTAPGSARGIGRGLLPEPVAAGWQGFSMEEARELAEATYEATLAKTPQEVLAELQKGNVRFWTGAAMRPEKSAFERRALISKQFPLVAVLGCSDSRVPVEIVFDAGLGDMFVVRVAGNCLDTTTLASLQYAVNHLKVKVLLVLGHEGCGPVKAAAAQQAHDIGKEPRALRTLLKDMKNGLDESRLGQIFDDRAMNREAVVTNVQRQMQTLSQDDSIMQKVQDGELLCVGALYEISSGIVDFLQEIPAGTLAYTAEASSQPAPVPAAASPSGMLESMAALPTSPREYDADVYIQVAPTAPLEEEDADFMDIYAEGI